jgi:hypothetical protein
MGGGAEVGGGVAGSKAGVAVDVATVVTMGAAGVNEAGADGWSGEKLRTQATSTVARKTADNTPTKTRQG